MVGKNSEQVSWYLESLNYLPDEIDGDLDNKQVSVLFEYTPHTHPWMDIGNVTLSASNRGWRINIGWVSIECRKQITTRARMYFMLGHLIYTNSRERTPHTLFGFGVNCSALLFELISDRQDNKPITVSESTSQETLRQTKLIGDTDLWAKCPCYGPWLHTVIMWYRIVSTRRGAKRVPSFKC